MDCVQAAAERAVAAAAAKERGDIEASVSSLVDDLQSRMTALASEVSAATTCFTISPVSAVTPTCTRHRKAFVCHPEIRFFA